ncbi:MAG: BamA/TamA family outer membrane protein [Balneolaceae bacterium]
MKAHKFLTHLFLLFFSFGGFYSAQAQTASTIDTVTTAFLPAITFNTDLGLVGGGLFSRYQYKENQVPFYSYLNASALISTKGFFQASVFHDKPNVFDSNLRITSESYISRFLQSQYYGIGNYQKLQDAPEGQPDFYLFKSFSTGFEVTLRRPVLITQKGKYLDILGLVIFDYKTPFDNGDDRLMEQEKPLGYGGARTAAFGTGFIWEGRNNEFASTAGTYIKTTAEFGQKFFGSSYNYLALKSDLRAYTSFYLFREVTFANRLVIEHTSGSISYWKMAEAGGEQTLRGYPENRFLDNNSLILNTELRTWLFEFPEYATRLGGTLFMDIGRTFPNKTALGDVFNDLKYTFGFGGTGSFFTPDFILRGDVGFSDEGVGIYFTAGYMF